MEKKGKGLFWEREMDFPTWMLHLAHQANARIIPFIHLYRRGKTRLIFKEPVEGHWEEGAEGYKRIITGFANLLESFILTYPEQYLGIYGPTVMAHYYQSYQKVKNERSDH